MKPLEYWRNEKVIYGRSDEGVEHVPIMKGVIRYPQEPPEPLGSVASRKRKRNARSQSRAASQSAPREPLSVKREDADLNPPELGWDQDTEAMGTVIDFSTQEEVDRRECLLFGSA